MLLHYGWYPPGKQRAAISGMRNVCLEPSPGLWDARSSGVRDELHTSASDRLPRCVTEETLVTCLLMSTVSARKCTGAIIY